MSHFLPSKQYWVASISWGNPHTDPPSGIRHLWACCIPAPVSAQGVSSHTILKNITRKFAPPIRFGSGYSLVLDVMQDIKPAKGWSAEAKARNRKRLMIQRAKKKDPLFADWVINQKMESDPDYYDSDSIASQSKIHQKMMTERFAEYEKRFIETAIVSATADQIRTLEGVLI